MNELLPILDTLACGQVPHVMCTLVQVKGSSYRRPGARMLISPQGLSQGILSAGCIESDLAQRVQSVLESGCPQLVHYDMGSELDRLWGTGMGCGGQAHILFCPMEPGRLPPWGEPLRKAHQERRPGVILTCYRAPFADYLGQSWWWDPQTQPDLPHPELLEAARKTLDQEKPQNLVLGEEAFLVEPQIPALALWIYGAGENARPLASLALQLGWDLGILDHREAMANRERFPHARWVFAAPPQELAAAFLGDGRTAAVVMSHIMDPDKAMLRFFLEQEIPYVGLQGNRTRTAQLVSELEEEGFHWTEERRQRLHAPMGLDLGAVTPQIIALSVLAEIQATINGRPALPLREIKGSIHG